jgi:uncharacterized protein YeaO (DUF488 family)
LTWQIKTKSVYDPFEESDGIRILVTRYHPRKKGFKKGIGYSLWLRNLSPANDIIKKFKGGLIGQSRFTKYYMDQISNRKQGSKFDEDYSKILELLHEGKTISLLCYEREGEFCHRHLLKSFIEKELEKAVRGG